MPGLVHNLRSRLAIALAPKQKTVTLGGGITPGLYGHMYARAAKQYRADAKGLAIAAESSTWIALAIDWRSAAVAKMPWNIINTITGDPVTNHAFHRMVAWMYLRYNKNFFYTWEASLMAHGESPFEKLYVGGIQGGLCWLNPTALIPYIFDDTIDYWEYTSTAGRVTRYDPSQLFIPRLMSLLDDLRGSSPTARAIMAANVDLEMQRYLRDLFANNASVGGWLTVRQGVTLTKEQEKAALEQFMAQTQESFSTLLLPYGLEYTPNQTANLPQTETLDRGTRDRLLAPYKVHPALITSGQVADPLSANGTMNSIKATGYEDVVIPSCEDKELYINEVIMPWLDPTGIYMFKWDFTEIWSLIKQTKERTEQFNAQFAGGAITRNELRLELGREPLPGGDHVVAAPGSTILIDVADLHRATELTAPPQPAPAVSFGLPSGLAAPQDAMQAALPPAAPALPAPTPAPVPQAAKIYVMLKLGAVPALVELQEETKQLHQQRYPDHTATWEDPQDFHISLVGIPLADDAQVQALADGLASLEALPELELKVGSLYRFNGLAENAIHFRIKPNEDLSDLQTLIYDLAQDCEMGCNDFSEPDKWIPHVTVGKSTARLRTTRNSTPRIVKPLSLVLSVDHETVYERTFGEVVQSTAKPAAPSEPIAPQPDPEDELRAWERKARGKNAHKAASFKTYLLPDDVTLTVRWGLHLGADIKTVFDIAGRMLNGTYEPVDMHYPHNPDAMICTCEECASIKAAGELRVEGFEYWKHYDELSSEIAEAWLTDYMAKVWARISSHITEGIDSSFDVLKPLNGLEDELIEAWLGTPDELGSLPKLAMAGMAAATTAIVNALPDPKAKSSLKEITAGVQWDQMSREAYEFAKSYLPLLIRGINQTTQEKVAGIIAAWIESGQPLSLLKTQLQEVFEDPKRAAAIAQTESNRVFQAGSESRYRSVGVKKAKWNTVKDNDVCPVCSTLDGKTANLDDGWSKGLKPPAHPRCRCWMNPVVTDAMWEEFTAEQ